MSTCGYPTNPLQLQGAAQFLLQSPTPALPPCAGAAFPEPIPGAGSWNGVPGNRETEELPAPQAAFNHFLGASSLFPRQAAALPTLAAASNSQKELWKSGETVRDTQGTAKSIPHRSLPKFHQRHKPCFSGPKLHEGRAGREGKGWNCGEPAGEGEGGGSRRRSPIPAPSARSHLLHVRIPPGSAHARQRERTSRWDNSSRFHRDQRSGKKPQKPNKKPPPALRLFFTHKTLCATTAFCRCSL